ncbi:MAG TPA: zf-HC2 domain-containing protein [Pyrinomonadaceae bacterium]|nr:zf-HC2 domain-containing protein [Pyrinomonadaceae bacterium]
MNCGFTEKISSLIDGELPAAEAREVERHLVTCSQCEEARADFLSLRSQISSFEVSLPGEVQNRALAKILAKRGASGAKVTWGWNWGYAAVALASIAIVALIIGLNFNQKPPEVATQINPVPASSPDAKPSPTTEPQQKPESPQQQPTPKPRRPAPVREPKPGEQFAVIPKDVQPIAPERTRPADAQTMTALHFEKAETLLRAFRNVQLDEPGAADEVRYERKRAKQLVYQNMLLRREADASGDVQVASLLDSLEPILLDIANLPDKPDNDKVRVIRERVSRKNIVALLQVNSTALARALD